MRPLAQADLDHVLEHTAKLWPELRGERVLLSGGTGFYGRWLVETFLYANRTLGLGAQLSVLCRTPQDFAVRAPRLCADSALQLLAGDVRNFVFPDGQFACILQAATSSVVPVGTPAQEQYSVIVDGTRRILEFAAVAGAERLLFSSSGAVYGPQPLTVTHVGEEQPFAPSVDPYTLGKRDAEAICRHAAPGLRTTLARGFAFFGPHMPLDAHFAAGNFFHDALRGIPILIKSDGSALRSFLYAADLAIWLWTILLRGEPGRAYNVGSEEAVSIRALAERVAEGVEPGLPVPLPRLPRSSQGAPERYVPSTHRARTELGLETWVNLDEAIQRTAAWHRDVLP